MDSFKDRVGVISGTGTAEKCNTICNTRKILEYRRIWRNIKKCITILQKDLDMSKRFPNFVVFVVSFFHDRFDFPPSYVLCGGGF